MSDVTTDEVASVGRRIVGRFVEGFVLALPSVLLYRAGLSSPGLLVGPMVVALEVVLLRTYGGHIGHLVLGMRAVTDAGLPTWSQAAARVAWYVLLPVWAVQLFVSNAVIDLITPVWGIALLVSLGRDPLHRGWHDKAADTTVVRVTKP
jgi:uncharacterized RDD family membrane protein YckC